MKFAFLRGAVRGEVFGEVWGEVFGEVFGLVLLGHSEQKDTFAQKSHGSAQPKWRVFKEKLHDKVLQGDPPAKIPLLLSTQIHQI